MGGNWQGFTNQFEVFESENCQSNNVKTVDNRIRAEEQVISIKRKKLRFSIFFFIESEFHRKLKIHKKMKDQGKWFQRFKKPRTTGARCKKMKVDSNHEENRVRDAKNKTKQ